MRFTFSPSLPARPAWRWLAIGAVLALLQACATGPQANPHDPLEPMNRRVEKFNEDLDSLVLKPVATTYKKVTPPLLRTGVSNFFNNISDVGSVFNNIFQLKVASSAEMLMRVMVNTTVGLGGVLDIASELNVERHPEDFGQTMGYWGVPPGPYLVLPLMGPSSLRDTSAMAVDYKGDVTGYVDPIGSRTAMGVLRTVNARANLLKLGNLLDEVALDKYSFIRDSYLQRRRSQVLDGQEPDAGQDGAQQEENKP